ncbi:HlyD family secretion protein [Celeribacter arenosi]|uniref:HlyD family efflux transporter periplasmic adaptor subunit n=1 Tax=Celeribacter arenosi TaxID=792649 RepID=A0ABP7JW01_9RHOB
MANLPDWLISLIAAVYPGINPPPAYVYDGYVEGDFVYAAAASGGRIEEIAAIEGQDVFSGALLFTLEDAQAQAGLRAAEAQFAQAQAELDNLTTGARDAEAEVIRAQLTQARVALDIAQTRLERSSALLSRGSIPQAQVDDQQAAVDEASAQVARLEAELRVAELPARDAQRRAGEAAVAAARAQLDIARETLADRKVFAPVTGRIDRVYFEAGEVTGAGAPVMSILQPDAMTALFFVPEAERADIKPNDMVLLTCEGCGEGIEARVTRLASDPQYTPPILYTRDERGRLVYRVEAEVLEPTAVLPGQPVTVDARAGRDN